jgi:hypothetical protein
VTLARYGWLLIACSSTGVLLIALINAIVDPYLYLDLISLDGVNSERTSLINKRTRVAKAAVLKHCPKQVLIFGSSRAEIALREDFQGYNGRSVYNAALAGSNIFEMKHVISFAENHQQPETVIIGLDFEGFTDRRRTSADFMDSDFSSTLEGRQFISYLRYLLSPQTLTASWNTIKANNTSTPSLCNSKGHLNVSKKTIDHRWAFSNVLTKMLVTPGAYPGFQYSAQRLAMLEEAISHLHKGKTDILLFFPPIHARQTEVIRGLGLHDTYEQWKMDVSSSIEKINARSNGKGRLELWDFSGYNNITTEQVPSLGSNIKMKWYRESSHYSRAAGDLVINRMLNTLNSDPEFFPDFGQKVTNNILSKKFMIDRKAAKHYALSHQHEILDVLKIIEKTKPERERIERSLDY